MVKVTYDGVDYLVNRYSVVFYANPKTSGIDWGSSWREYRPCDLWPPMEITNKVRAQVATRPA